MNRLLEEPIKDDLKDKLVLLSGPRQVGKTTLSLQLFANHDYLNADKQAEHQRMLATMWDRQSELVIFDELHKIKGWKRWLKGVFDTESIPPGLLVTGSARMDTYKKGGDSLAGRHHSYQLHPVTVKELREQAPAKEALSSILRFGGFPEPLLKGEERFARRWRKSHLERILREDLLDLERVRDIKSIEILVELLGERVGSPLSYTSLANDLQVSSHTIKHWLSILESLYVVFPVYPYHRNIARAILKMPKYYFYDCGALPAKEGLRLENAVACGLRAEMDFLLNTEGVDADLRYVRDKQGREVDFLTLVDRQPKQLVEVKLSDTDISRSLAHFANGFTSIDAIQIVHHLERKWSTKDGIRVMPVCDFLIDHNPEFVVG